MNGFVDTSKAIEAGIIPDQGIIGIQGSDDIYTGIFEGKRFSTVSCEIHPQVSFVLEGVKNKCSALTDEGKCSLTFRDENTPLEDCPIITILNNFSPKKETA